MTRDTFLTLTRQLPAPVRVTIIVVMGGTVLLIGAALLVLPGPGIPVLILGLGILAIEFAWARRALSRVHHHSRRALSIVTTRTARRRPRTSTATTPSSLQPVTSIESTTERGV